MGEQESGRTDPRPDMSGPDPATDPRLAMLLADSVQGAEPPAPALDPTPAPEVDPAPVAVSDPAPVAMSDPPPAAPPAASVEQVLALLSPSAPDPLALPDLDPDALDRALQSDPPGTDTRGGRS